MLTYTVNKNNFRSQLTPIRFDKIEILGLPATSENGDKSLVVFYCPTDKRYDFNEGEQVVIENRLDINNNNNLNTSSYNFTEKYNILSVNEEKGLFTIMIDKFYTLELESIVSVTEEDSGSEKWFFHFGGNGHYFENIEEGSTIESLPVKIYIEYQYTDDSSIVNGLAELDCEYVSPYEISCAYNEVTMGKLKGSIFNDENPNNATVVGLKVYRETPFFRRTNNVFVYIDRPICSISIPLSLNFETNLYQSELLESQFTEDERNKSINRIVDMEKDVYHPVVWNSSIRNSDGTRGNYVDGISKEAEKIVFNLHFRQHRGDNWLVEPDTYWNGCEVDGSGRVSLFSNDYFSYGNSAEEKSKQSDLLTYLGFDNTDVRYQKSKLSRSFLRVMFYDSMNTGNQNLLYYSTIFINAGKLFGKYIKYIEDEPYCSISDSGEVTPNLVGIKVDREPYGRLLKDEDDNDRELTIDEIEGIRLSSQITVQDKYQTESSSDGFYLYLWKDNDNGVIPTDIYMKVEFNHAGYGRTIPFMMPFYDPNNEEGTGIKTFQEILDDWNNEETRYGARRYLKYSYIRFKYKYDKIHKQHIYYMDDEFYGNGVHFEDNVITINLYEAKMI